MMSKYNTSVKSIQLDLPRLIRDIMKRLHQEGFQAFVVGGAIRDHYLNRPILDWDVATSAGPDTIRALFYDLKTFSLKHDTVTLIQGNHQCEITPFRGPEENPTIQNDLSHRDLTIDAMAYDMTTQEVLDPHNGQGDIAQKIVRAVGVPEDRFIEDPIRLLRAVRIARVLGFGLEQKTQQTITWMAEHVTRAAPERVRDELLKILLTHRPSAGFRLLHQTGLLRHCLPEILEGHRKKQNAHHQYTIYRHIMETLDHTEPEPIMRLTALFHDIAKPRVRRKIKGVFRFHGHEQASAILANDIMKRLRFSNETMNTVTHLIRHHWIGYDPEWTDGGVRRFVRRVGPEHVTDLIRFRRADLIAHGRVDKKIDLLLELERRVGEVNAPSVKDWSRLAINGNMVMETLGLSPGPKVGQILHTLMERVLDNPEYNTKTKLIAMVNEMAGLD
jgi:poly(A) polymerase/tRNA nucleotidyltransferase (CCA-adding enzyme)